MKYFIPKLEFHASHACNLTCESCAHYSNYGFFGSITPEEFKKQIEPWALRIDPGLFSIMGGEPTLNSKLTEIVKISIKLFPRIEVVTNGLFLKHHPDLGIALSHASDWSKISISIHGDDYPDILNDSIELAKQWQHHYGIRLEIRKYKFGSWTRRYTGHGTTMRPYQHGNPNLSFSICPAKQCFQLYDGKLWKCPIVAYLPMVVDRYDELRDPWTLGLSYKPLSINTSDIELESFIKRGPENICGLCPSQPQPFTPPSTYVKYINDI